MSSPLATRRLLLMGLLLLAVVLTPLVTDDFQKTVITVALLYATVGIAWNLMMGFAGLLSLGHALYFGIGAYCVAILSGRYGITPWAGMVLAFALGAALGAMLGALGFRFGVKGVYFALLTIAFAEMARVLFEHWEFVGRTGGFFLAALTETNVPLISLRGSATFFFYALAGTTALFWVAAAALINSRLGFFWRAIREDEDAARAMGVRTFRMKVLAVALSGGMTAISGGWFGLINGSLFPETVLGMRVSIDFIIAPIVGGLGTMFGPILGSFVVIPFNEIAKEVGQATGINGINILIYGVLLFLVIVLQPQGCWPWLSSLLGLSPRRKEKR